MPIDTVASLADDLRRYRLLEPAQLDELARDLQARFPEPRALAGELVRRGWLTPYQVNQVFRGKGAELLLGSYVLLERLGEGGMGQVFKARNWKLGQIVAVKMIRKERLATADALRRFQREIRAAAQLDHPHIVRAIDADEVGGVHLFVMEYVEGIDLARLVKQHGLPPMALACQYIRQAALGLQHAYEREMVHRDIKPHNLLLVSGRVVSGEWSKDQPPLSTQHSALTTHHVKILDMGLARFTTPEDEGDSSSTLTQEGTVIGTPDYMAPEQARESHGVDIRADLYSLGCTLYFLLTGRVPFPGGTMTEKLLRHQLDQPTPIEQLRPETPDAVTAVAYRLMAKKPDDRFQTPAELAEHLRLLLPSKGDGLKPKAQAARPAPEQTEEMASPSAFWAGVVAETAAVAPAPASRLRDYWLLAASGAVLATVMLGIALLMWPGRGRPTEPVVEKPPQDKGKEGAPVASAPPSAIAPFDEKKAREYQQLWADHLQRPVEETNSIGMKLVLIPPGEFLMGLTAEEVTELLSKPEVPGADTRIKSSAPRHRVRLTQPFLMGKFEVTQHQYEKVTGQTPSAFSPGGRITELKDKVAGIDTGSHPVEAVTWFDCAAFCNRLSQQEGLPPYYLIAGTDVTVLGGLGYHLPTEAQWEFGCRAGSETPFFFGNDWRQGDEYLWSHSNGKRTTRAVGQKRANGFGLHDMHGNVDEWCEDWHGLDYYASLPAVAIDPSGPAMGTKRAHRGGNVYLSAYFANSGYRVGRHPKSEASHVGFRVVREIGPPPSAAEILTSPDWEWTKPENLGPAVNSTASDFMPAVTADGLCLVFASNRKDGARLYEALRASTDKPFADAQMLEKLIVPNTDSTRPWLSGDGLTLLFTPKRPGKPESLGIWMSRRAARDKPWGAPEDLGKPINTGNDDRAPALSPNGLTLYFSSNRANAQNFDLYASHRKTLADPWGEPKPLPDVNTDGRESGPRPLDDKSFVFTRDGVRLHEWLLATAKAGGGWETKSLGVFGKPTYGDPSFTGDGRTVFFESPDLAGQGKADLWLMRRVPKAKAPGP